MVLTVRHGPNFAPPGTSKPSEKDPPRLKRFRRNRPTNYSLGWQIHTSAFLGRKADLPEQADQLRNDAGFDFFEPISCHQRCSDLDKESVGAGYQKPRSCISSLADFTGDRLRYVVNLRHLCLFDLPR